MSAREPGPVPKANGAQLVVDRFLRGWRSMKKKKKSRVTRAMLALAWGYRGISLIRNSASLGPYSRTMPRALWGS